MAKRESIGERSIAQHKKLKGKLEIKSKPKLLTQEDLSLYYTPGVGAVSSYLHINRDQTRNLTIKGNCVAVVTDGSAVLGLGNIGPEAALPVMEGKAILFKEFAGIDAFPICLATQDTDKIIETVVNIAPVFGGINLEDIAAPRCFEIEDRLKDLLDIPVLHDDQHGTAIVVLAGVINAFKVAEKDIETSRIVLLGAGAAGAAITRLLHTFGARNMILVDSKGIIHPKREDLSGYKRDLANITNQDDLEGGLDIAMKGADALIGVSNAGLVNAAHVRSMNSKAIVMAMANPTPEIKPSEALEAGAYIVATGRSDYPNQINNVLGFPGIFRGALDHGVKKITTEMELQAAQNLASLVTHPTPEKIIPSVFDEGVVKAVAQAIK